MTDLPLTKVAEDASTITLGWTPPAGAAGYTFWADGKRVSSTLDGTRSTAKFAKVASGLYAVNALGVVAVGSYPPIVPPPPPPPGESRLVLDFEPGNLSNFTGVESHDSSQTAISTSKARQGWGKYSCLVSDFPNSYWNGFLRCLITRYDSHETAGQEYWWAGSMWFPSSPNPIANNVLLFELHHPSTLYNLNGLSVAPHAINYNAGNLECRIATGNGIVGQGWTTWHPHNPLAAAPHDRWVDLIVNIRFSEGNDGYVKYYVDPTGSAAFDQAKPTFQMTGIPTLPFCNSANVHNVQLYTEFGLYNNAGKNATQANTDSYYTTGWRRETSWADAVKAWG